MLGRPSCSQDVQIFTSMTVGRDARWSIIKLIRRKICIEDRLRYKITKHDRNVKMGNSTDIDFAIHSYMISIHPSKEGTNSELIILDRINSTYRIIIFYLNQNTVIR